jgi:outer membrane protein OmpA-like peptidoglycan-associated protein
VQSVGKGETNFIAINKDAAGKDSPEGRKFNRRVELELKGEGVVVKLINSVPDALKIK